MFASEAFVLSIPVVVKARSDAGRRLIDVQASSEAVDLEGDVILQRALLGSAESFVRTGVVDIDHVSEVGQRLGIEHAAQYIIGIPTAVKDLGSRRTGVEAELNKGAKASEVWQALLQVPPVRYYASIYGFPHKDGMVDVRAERDPYHTGASRFVVSKIEWRSLALTRNPVNNHLDKPARIITAKAYTKLLAERYYENV